MNPVPRDLLLPEKRNALGYPENREVFLGELQLSTRIESYTGGAHERMAR